MTNEDVKAIDKKMNKNGILLNNKEAIEAELDKVQSRSKTRNISYNDIVNSCKEVENYLGISKKNLVGTSVSVNLYAHRFPSSYRWIPEGTEFKARYTASGWRVTAISRCNCNHQRRLYLHLNDSAKSALVEHAESGKWF